MNFEKKNLWSYLIAGIVALSLLAYLFAFQVEAGRQAVVFRFGKVRTVMQDPGLYLKLPYPIETVRVLDGRARLLDTKISERPTRDKININFTITIAWRVSDLLNFVRSFDSVPSAEEKLLALVNSARNKALSDYTFHDLVQTDFETQQARFAKFQTDILDLVKKDAEAQRWGVSIDTVYVKNMTFPTEVSEKVFERMKAERQQKATALRTEGENQATIIKTNARTQAETVLAKAREESEKIRGTAEAEAAKNYEVFRKNPELANFLRRLRSLRTILADSKGATVVLTTDDMPFDLLKDASRPEAGGTKGGK